MLDAIICKLNQLFLYGLSINIHKDDAGEKSIRLKIKDLLIKDEQTSGVMMESLILSVVALESPGQECGIDFQNASYVVEKLTLLFSQDWVNHILRNDDTLEKHGIRNVEVDFTPDVVRIKGEFKAGINVKASVYLKLEAEDGKLRIELDKVTALNKISLPRFIQRAVIGILEKYAQEKLPDGVSLIEGGFLIDFLSMVPVDLHLKLLKVYMDDENLALQGGANLQKALEKIRLRKQMEKDRESLDRTAQAEPGNRHHVNSSGNGIAVVNQEDDQDDQDEPDENNEPSRQE